MVWTYWSSCSANRGSAFQGLPSHCLLFGDRWRGQCDSGSGYFVSLGHMVPKRQYWRLSFGTGIGPLLRPPLPPPFWTTPWHICFRVMDTGGCCTSWSFPSMVLAAFFCLALAFWLSFYFHELTLFLRSPGCSCLNHFDPLACSLHFLVHLLSNTIQSSLGSDASCSSGTLASIPSNGSSLMVTW